MADIVKPRVIAGFGRSGTTWVQDVLAQANSLRAIFEVLHPRAIRGAAQHAHTYLARGDDDEALYRLLCRYFFDDFQSMWADYRIQGNWLYPRPRELTSWSGIKRFLRRIARSKKYYLRYRTQRQNEQRIVKFIRANMILSWLQEKFDARIVFIIRHPAAVLISQLNSARVWNPYHQIDRYRANTRLQDVLDGPTRNLLFRSLDDVEAVTLCWCLENTIALKQAQESDILVVHYEEILERGHSEWRRILSALDLREMPDADLISRPSQQAWSEHALDPTQVCRYASWMGRIDAKTAARIQNILDATGMLVYSVDQALPVARVINTQR